MQASSDEDPSVTDSEPDSSEIEELAPEKQQVNGLKMTKKRKSDEEVDSSKKFKKERPSNAADTTHFQENDKALHTTLFQLQINELLSEVRVKEKMKNKMQDFIEKLCRVIKSMNATQACDINKHKWIKKQGVRVPIPLSSQKTQGTFQFIAPSVIHNVGSFTTDTAISPNRHVDLAVVMPKECIYTMDYLNQRYLRKRALYLSCIAAELRQWDGQSDLQFFYHHNNHLKPTLEVKPAGKLGKQLTVHIHVIPENGKLKMNRFNLRTNNVRKQWFFQLPEETDQIEEYNTCETEKSHGGPTPFYNASILSDLNTQQNSEFLKDGLEGAINVQDAVCLLKIWLHQRQLDQGFGSFNGFVMTMLVVHLLKKKEIRLQMTNFQIFKTVLHHLVQADWTMRGINLCTTVNKEAPSTKEFHEAYPVVFVDSSGYNNICANMIANTFERVKHEAKLSLQHLDNPNIDGFDMLFMKSMPFYKCFDQIICISDLKQLELLYNDSRPQLINKMLDYCGDYVSASVLYISQLLQQTISKRINFLHVQRSKISKWDIKEKAPNCADLQQTLIFGVLLNNEHCNSIIDKGPCADDTDQAENFRCFWGDLSELRRFQDGTVCEAVVWKGCDTLASKRKVLGRAVKYILSRHCNLSESSVTVVTNPFEKLLKLPVKNKAGNENSSPRVYSTGEEQHVQIIKAFDELCKNLRSLNDLPLTINTIQGTAPAFRYSDTFPAITSVTGDMVKSYDNKNFPMWTQPAPHYIQSMSVMCVLEGSGKWPDDSEAVCRIKAALLLKLKAKLEQVHNLITSVTPDYLNVLKNGFVFQLRLGCKREIALAKLSVLPNGLVKTSDTEQSLNLEKEIVALPKLASILHGIQQQHTSFCNSVRLAKRWVSAHMLLGHYVPEEAVELIVTYLYLEPAPYTASNSSFIVFIRFLDFLATWDWNLHPLIINLNNNFTKDDYDDIKKRFNSDRTVYPLMFIATPGDVNSSLWTKNKPTPLILNRLVHLAKESIKLVEGHLQDTNFKADFIQIFRPPLDAYDVLIHLNVNQISRRIQQIPQTSNQHQKLKKLRLDPVDENYLMPVVDYDPVQCYVKELRESYGDLALFFDDIYGGEVLGVLWKPNVFQPKLFSVSHVKAHLPKSSGKEVKLSLNLSAIIHDFQIIGQELCKRVEQKKT